jgi:hypothetical protein
MRLLLFLLLLTIPRLGLAASDNSAEERFVVHYAVRLALRQHLRHHARVGAGNKQRLRLLPLCQSCEQL